MPSRTHKASITRRCVASLISAASIAAILTVTPIQAAEWRIEPLIRVAGETDDNANLSTRTDEDTDISGYIIDASAKFAYASELTTFFVTPTLRSRDYGDPDYDSDDQFLDFNFTRDTQSSIFRIRGSYNRESVRTAERADTDLDIEDPDEIPDNETGRVFIRDQRELFRISPSWTYRMSDASSFSVDLNYTDATYDEVFDQILSDYDDTRANLSYRRTWSPRNTAILTGTYRQYNADLNDDDVTGAGINAGFERELSETSRLKAVLGVEDTDQGLEDTDVNWVGDISLTRRLQTITLLAQYRRTINASGRGFVSVRDSINLNFTRRLNERISAGLGVRAYQDSGVSSDAGSAGNDYLQLRAQVTWNMTRTWSLEGNYRYTFLDRSVLGESANSNAVTVWLTYRPTPIIRSR